MSKLSKLSKLFNAAFYGFTALAAILAAPLLLLPTRRPLMSALRLWAKGVVGLMRGLAGIRVEVRGREHLPKSGPVLLAAKHHSEADGILMLAAVDDLAVVATRDLMNYPLIGRLAKKLEMILVDTSGAGNARGKLSRYCSRARDDGRPILIYPEGQLTAVGARERYKTGIHDLYADFGLPVTPVATNLGLCWPQRLPEKRPGTAVIEFLPPIQPGLDRDGFMWVLENRIEAQTARLVAQAAPRRALPLLRQPA